ncbi:nucleotide sugar dehydrogenase [Amycolatopsis keratiniphila]|uniref:UDP-N-acetyl-D-glucosamine dehydrogenase n=1 Tax=Amycolatopsis keratiniphila subsp. keratiniphila TaxID=227715 RepID=A0A1W2M3N8_9PSEU|nr:nucleotide sugar dehydrogenase [Amycolatopsis keratiniphila]ONF74423.1 UDP-N-acetyl-D-glucosamine dehydrogenase [Amycolatopsis keratiniphila subsp. keratiniphila]
MSIDVVVVGVGYVGLPLAEAVAGAGLSVIGYDTSPLVAAEIAAGRPHVPDVSASRLRAMRANGFTVTTDPEVLGGAETIVLCVPTGLTTAGGPDLAAVRRAVETVSERLAPGMLVIVESTSFPGTTDEIVRPILEKHGLTAGTDFSLAYSPERVDPGNTRFGIRNTPKVISGHTPSCAKRCAEFYERFVDTVVIARGTREAEMAKLLENTYRYVNIALVNEIAIFCDRIGVDVWDVMHCAATKPFGFTPFAPGPGVGGHCIPVDPKYLLDKAEREGALLGVVHAARLVDDRMPEHVVERVTRLLAEHGKPLRGAKVLLLGVSYKADVPDTRESAAIRIALRLRGLGADLSYHDPVAETVPELGPPVADLDATLRTADVAVLLVAHRAYDHGRLASTARLLFDVTGRVPGKEVVRL